VFSTPLQSSSTTRRRIVFVTPQYPYPPEQGTALRNLGLVRGMARAHDVTLLTFGRGAQQPDDPLVRLCRRIETVPVPDRSTRDRLRTLVTTADADMAHRLLCDGASAALRDILSREQVDVVQVEGIELAPYALQVAAERSSAGPRLVFDDHNVEYLLQRRAGITDWRRPGRWPAALYSHVQWRRLAALEARLCRVADAVLVVSEEDGVALQSIVPELNPIVIPNGLDANDYVRPNGPAPLTLLHPAVLFTGKMDYRPNVDATLWFYWRVWPQVQRVVPGAHFYVVGQNPDPSLRALHADPTVTVTGYVKDVLPYFHSAEVYVAPFRMGSGTRLKILQALAAALPLVTTTLGAEGIAVVDGVHARVVDDASRFAQAVATVIRDADQARTLGANGRELVASQYDWSAIVPQLEAVYNTL